MKTLVNSALLSIALLLLSVNTAIAAPTRIEQAKVVYQDTNEVTHVNYNQCIPFKNSDCKLVNDITFPFQVECNLYRTGDCSNQPIGANPYVIGADDKIIPAEIDDDYPKQSILCTLSDSSF